MPSAKISQQEAALWYQWPLYSWASVLIFRGYLRAKKREKMEISDMLRLPSFEDPAKNAELLQASWKREIERKAAERALRGENSVGDNSNDDDPPSLLRAIFTAYWKRIAVAGVVRLIGLAATLGGPYLLQWYIKWLYDPWAPTWKGFFIASLMALVSMTRSFTMSAYFHHTMTSSSQIASALGIMVYDASLQLDHNHNDTGKITSLHSTDTTRIGQIASVIHGTWAPVVLLIGATIALYTFLGWAGPIAVAVLTIFVPIQAVLMKFIFKYRMAMIKAADKRVETVNELLQGIRICKFMNWSAKFEERIAEKRGVEVEHIRNFFDVRAVILSILESIPLILLIAMFGAAYILGQGINPSNVFPALSMLALIRIPAITIPMMVTMLQEVIISVGRITELLQRKSARTEAKFREDEVNAVVLQGVTIMKKEGKEDKKEMKEKKRDGGMMMMGMGGSSPTKNPAPPTAPPKLVPLLSDLSLSIPKGKLTIITGPTGCGKSSLLSTIIGECICSNDSQIFISGSIAYVPQEAWLMNATVKDNILLSEKYEQEKYEKVVHACQLIDDFAQLPSADETEVGERGITLSGGQKQRVAFARAVYSDHDIVLMDDPLSAVDSHVCQALFDQCIIEALQDKTRVLVTHQVQFLPQADFIVVMDKTAIKFVGSYEQMVALGVTLSEDTPQKTPPPTPAVTSSASPKNLHKKDSAATAATLAMMKIGKGDKLMTDEEQFVGSISWSVYGWYFKLGGVVTVMCLISLYCLYRGVISFKDLWMSWWATKSDPFGKNLSTGEFFGYLVLIVAVSITLLWIRHRTFRIFVVSAAAASHGELVKGVSRAPISFFDTTPVGRILNRFTKDIQSLDTSLPESCDAFVNMLLNVLGMLVVILITSPVFLAFVPLFYVVGRTIYMLYTPSLRGLKRLQGICRSPMMAIMNETLSGLATIRAYKLSQKFSAKHASRSLLARKPMYCVRMCQRWLIVRTEILGCVILFVTAYLGAMTKTFQDRDWTLTSNLGLVSLSVWYAADATSILTSLTDVTASMETEMTSAERVLEYSRQLPQERDVTYGNGPDEIPQPPKQWPQKGGIVFKNVQMRYRDELPLVLKNISFEVCGGEKIGVVGRTGSGKSTIMLTLFRMVELAGGSITIDGVDIANVALDDLRSSVTIIPQDPLLFAGTVRSNIDPFNNCSDEELWSVISKVKLEQRVKENEKGLDGPVDEKGGNFSVGQRQLMCLARALLKQAKILLLDEATASVDFDSDALIQQTIRQEFRDCTVLTIAHRLATVIDSDRILVLGDGEIIEYDQPAVLLRNEEGELRSMVAQLGDDMFVELQNVAEQAAAASKTN